MKLRTTLLAFTLFLASCGEPVPDPPSQTNTAIQRAPAPKPRRVVATIPPDHQLYYIDVPITGHFDGRLRAGDHVDLLAVLEVPQEEAAGSDAENAPMPTAQLLLQNVTLTDVDVDEGAETGRLGMALTTEEIQLVAVTQRNAPVVVLARNPSDVAVQSVSKTSLREALEDIEVHQEKRKIRTKNRRPTVAQFPASIPMDERGMVVQLGLPADTIRSGDSVDIYGLFEPEQVDTTFVMSLLQRAKVLETLADGYAVLSVTTNEAEFLALARHRGDLFVGVRHPEDIETSHLTKKTLREVVEDLEVIQEKRMIRIRKRPKQKKSMGIEIIRGDSGGSVAGSPVVKSPQPRERYQELAANDFVDVADDPLSTFAIDVDTGSFANVRRMLTAGHNVPTSSVRPEEFLNYFAYDYPQPESGVFGVTTELAPSPFSTRRDTKILRVGVQGESSTPESRKPVHLTFLVDVSGSMSDPNKLPLAQQALHYLVNNLRSEDTVAIATYAGETSIALTPTGMEDRATILNAIDDLSASGGTAMGDGITLAYGLADESRRQGHHNRVIVLSDGDANIGETSWESMLEKIEDEVNRGITLTTIGLGSGNYNEEPMEQLANKGNGNYFYVDSFAEAKRVFGSQLDGTLRTIAKDVKIQVDFNPNAVERYRLIGYENRAVADADFRNDAVDGGEIGAGHQVTALYEVVLTDDEPSRIATVRVRHKTPEGSKSSEQAFEVERSSMRGRLGDASADFRFAASVAAFAEILREGPGSERLNFDWILEVAQGATDGRPERQELLELIELAR